MIKEKYKQLCLSLQFGGIRTMNIHRRWATLKKKIMKINYNQLDTKFVLINM